MNLVGKKRTCTECKTREPEYFMNRIKNVTFLTTGYKAKKGNKWICDTCLS